MFLWPVPISVTCSNFCDLFLFLCPVPVAFDSRWSLRLPLVPLSAAPKPPSVGRSIGWAAIIRGGLLVWVFASENVFRQIFATNDRAVGPMTPKHCPLCGLKIRQPPFPSRTLFVQTDRWFNVFLAETKSLFLFFSLPLFQPDFSLSLSLRLDFQGSALTAVSTTLRRTCDVLAFTEGKR